MVPYVRRASFGSPSLRQAHFGLAARLQCVTVSGRTALARLAELLKLGAKDRVLLPAYHCPSMVEPFMHAGCELEFYKLDGALAPDLADFMRALSVPPRLVVFVKFFGFEAAIDECATLARAAGASIVHDCAHAWYALPRIAPSDYAIASLVKFFAVEEGGLLLAPSGTELTAPAQAPGLRRNLRLISRAWARRQAALSAPAADNTAAKVGIPEVTSVGVNVEPRSAAFRYFDPLDVERDVTFYTSLLLKILSSEQAAQRRRQHYQQLAAVLGTLRGVKLLHERLPDDVVPYVLPLLLDDGQRQFDALRGAGIPLYRWEELIPSHCETSGDYRMRLVQLPCHQDLTAIHMDVLRAGLSRCLGPA
jgi:perosamine synthetase